MSKTRSDILVEARHAGWVWAHATADQTKKNLSQSHTLLYEALEELSQLTERGETTNT